MTFSEAMKHIQAGRPVRIRWWRRGSYVASAPWGGFMVHWHGHSTMCEWAPTREDRAADWELRR